MEYLTDTEHLSTDNGNNEREWNFEFHLGCEPTKLDEDLYVDTFYTEKETRLIFVRRLSDR